ASERTVDDALDDPVADLVDPRAHEYRERAARVAAAGVSHDGEVTLTTRGLVEWSVTVAPGVPRRLTTEAFVAALDFALAWLLADYHVQVLKIHRDLYGSGADHARSR